MDPNNNKINLDTIQTNTNPENNTDFPEFPLTDCWDEDYNQNNLLTPDGQED